MANIHVLSSHVANLIAAGEVVEKPASAAKELIENAVDAGATAVTVEIKSGGVAYLRVTDNGCGISREDVPTAFKRHSTSKIREEEDLACIGTLGFRGEALAAIASVSKIDLLTKRRDDEIGTGLHLEGGSIGKIEDAGCPDGTTIVVRNLFYNTPARMKFLKRDAAEGAAVESIVQAAALSHPEISVKFIREGKQVLHTPGDGNLLSCIYSVFGRDTALGMLEAKSAFESVHASGFVSKPINSRGNRMMQYFFVNGRAVKSRLMSAALDEAYKDCIMKGRYPACVMFIDMPLELVDVNVHPAKTEVKFAREREVFDAVYFAAKSGLETDNGRTAADFKPAARPVVAEKAAENQSPAAEEKNQVKSNTRFFAKSADTEPTMLRLRDGTVSHEKRDFDPARDTPLLQKLWGSEVRAGENADEAKHEPQVNTVSAVCDDKETVPEQIEMPLAPPVVTTDDALPAEKTEEAYRVVGEVLDTYIIVEQGESMLLIDKHAAHERIIFNRLKKEQEAPQSQMLITPSVVNLTRSEIVAVMENREGLEKIGFEIDEFGEDSVAVRRLPDGISEGEISPIINEIAQSLIDGRIPGSIEKLDAVRHSVACKAAIKAGKKSDMLELVKIAEGVMSDPDVRYCPHGRPVTVEMTRYQLEKQFKRVT